MGTVINYLVFYLIYSIWNVHYILACIVGYVSGLFLGFYLNKEWTFKRNDHVFSGKSLVLRYICLYGFTLVVAVLVLYLIAEIANRCRLESADVVELLDSVDCRLVISVDRVRI